MRPSGPSPFSTLTSFAAIANDLVGWVSAKRVTQHRNCEGAVGLRPRPDPTYIASAQARREYLEPAGPGLRPGERAGADAAAVGARPAGRASRGCGRSRRAGPAHPARTPANDRAWRCTDRRRHRATRTRGCRGRRSRATMCCTGRLAVQVLRPVRAQPRARRQYARRIRHLPCRRCARARLDLEAARARRHAEVQHQVGLRPPPAGRRASAAPPPIPSPGSSVANAHAGKGRARPPPPAPAPAAWWR